MQNDVNVLTINGVVSVNHNVSGSISVGSGGGGGNDNAILSGVWTKSSYSNSNITKLLPGLPDNVEFSNVTEVGDHACEHSFGGKNWNLPECLTVGMYAFHSNSTIISINLPKCTELSSYAFNGCQNLATINLPKCETIGQYAFSGVAIQNFDLPECVSLSGSAFRNCSSLVTINLPKCESVGESAFVGCTNLVSINLPKIKTIGNNSFQNVRSLTTVELGEDLTSIGNSAFLSCSALESITIHATTPPNLNNSGVFNGTTCTFYVPAASVETYKAASVWSSYASRIAAIPNE